MTRVSYRQELERIAALLGVDLAAVVQEVEDLKRRKTAENTIRTTAEDDRNGYKAALVDAANAMDRARDELMRRRERAHRTAGQAYVDMTDVAGLLDAAAIAACRVLAKI